MTGPAVYVEPISYADVQRVVADPLRFPTPVSVVGALMSVTKTVVNDGGALLYTLKLNEILGVETDAAWPPVDLSLTRGSMADAHRSLGKC